MNRAIIFDFDGTIVDSLPAVIRVFESLTKRPQKFTPAEVEQLRHLSLVELAVDLKVPRWKVPLLLFRGRRMIRNHLRSITVHVGVEEVLGRLHASGERLYVLSSNSTDNVRQYLKWHDLTQYFSGIYGGASLLGKAPRLTKLIAREAVDVTKSWYVGDETRDIIAAHAVGLRAMSVSWGYNSHEALAAKEPDALVDTPAELLAHLEDHGRS